MRIFILSILLSISGYTYAQWQNVSNYYPFNIKCFAHNGDKLFAGTFGNGIYVSSNNGDNWVEINNGINGYAMTVYSLFVYNSLIYAGTRGGLYYSVNEGQSWTLLVNYEVNSIELLNDILFIGVSDTQYSILLSTDNGHTWIPSGNGIPTSILPVNQIKVKGTDLYALKAGDLYRSTNTGNNWSEMTYFYGLLVDDISVSGNNIFIGTYYGGMFFSSNNGLNWSARNNGLNNTRINTIKVSGPYIFIGTDNYFSSGGVYYSTNNGAYWILKSQGLNNYNGVDKLDVSQNYIVAVTGGPTVPQNWRRSFSEIIGSNISVSVVPSSYCLCQNYPNPFNPVTMIVYSIIKVSDVSLKVFDATGKEVSTVVNERQSAGTYETVFDASHLPSGVYFYRLTAEGFSETKKMIVIK